MKTQYKVITEWKTGLKKVNKTFDNKEEADVYLLAMKVYCSLKNINTEGVEMYVKEVNQ